jgi:hypothetical protein
MVQEEPKYVRGEVTLQYPKMQAVEVATAAVVVVVVVAVPPVDVTADTVVDETVVVDTDEAFLLELGEQADTTSTSGNARARAIHRHGRVPEIRNIMFPTVYHQCGLPRTRPTSEPTILEGISPTATLTT